MQSEVHLKRIRIRLTLIYVALMAVGLLALSVLAINVDTNVRTNERDQDLLIAAQRGAQLVGFDDAGNLVTGEFESDESITNSYPQLWVYAPDTSEAGAGVVVAPREDWFESSDHQWLGASLIEGDNIWTNTLWNDDPSLAVVARGVPVIGRQPEHRAAVIAVADSNDWFEAHTSFRNRVLLIAGALVLASAFGGYALAGRAIRPTAVALEQQEQLISNAAHELRTPVARIRAAAEGGIAGDEPADQALNRVVTVAENAGIAIDDLLTLARMDAGKQTIARESLRLDLLAEQVADDYKNVTCRTVPTIVEGDPGLLRRAVDNLLRNATEHGASPGVPPRIDVTVYPSCVIVTDNGPGLDETVTPHVFERFRSRPGSDGHGLGLPIVRWIVRAHGGSVTAENTEDGGASFIIDLEPPRTTSTWG